MKRSGLLTLLLMVAGSAAPPSQGESPKAPTATPNYGALVRCWTGLGKLFDVVGVRSWRSVASEISDPENFLLLRMTTSAEKKVNPDDLNLKPTVEFFYLDSSGAQKITVPGGVIDYVADMKCGGDGFSVDPIVTGLEARITIPPGPGIAAAKGKTKTASVRYRFCLKAATARDQIRAAEILDGGKERDPSVVAEPSREKKINSNPLLYFDEALPFLEERLQRELLQGGFFGWGSRIGLWESAFKRHLRGKVDGDTSLQADLDLVERRSTFNLKEQQAATDQIEKAVSQDCAQTGSTELAKWVAPDGPIGKILTVRRELIAEAVAKAEEGSKPEVPDAPADPGGQPPQANPVQKKPPGSR